MHISHIPMQDKQIIAFIDTIFPKITFEKLNNLTHEDLDLTWRKWLLSSNHNTISGLDFFKYSSFSPGTTDAFGEFISRYPNRRIRVSRNDFILTKILSKSYNRELLYLEDSKIERDDCLIISLPFSGNGDIYPNFDDLLNDCDKSDVPVFIDGAYFGISNNIHYPLDRKCIKDFVLSLSKNLAGNPLRLGIRFTKEQIDDGITAGLLGSDIFDRLGSYISIELLNNFSHNWTIEKYRNKSNEICEHFGLIPTKTFTIAIGPENMIQFKRGDYVRISITEELSRVS